MFRIVECKPHLPNTPFLICYPTVPFDLFMLIATLTIVLQVKFTKSIPQIRGEHTIFTCDGLHYFKLFTSTSWSGPKFIVSGLCAPPTLNNSVAIFSGFKSSAQFSLISNCAYVISIDDGIDGIQQTKNGL